MKKAFTLLEVLVVIVIIGILFTLLITYGASVSNKSKEQQVLDDFQDYADQLVSFMTYNDMVSELSTDWDVGAYDSGGSLRSEGDVCYGNTSTPKWTSDGNGKAMVKTMNMLLKKVFKTKLSDFDLSDNSSLDVGGGQTCIPPMTLSDKDPWGNEYQVYGSCRKTVVDEEVHNRDTVVIYSGGKDSKSNAEGDYAVVICKIDGNVSYGTIGFSTNVGHVVAFNNWDMNNTNIQDIDENGIFLDALNVGSNTDNKNQDLVSHFENWGAIE